MHRSPPHSPARRDSLRTFDVPTTPTSPVHLFVLGTGRCGTQTLARMLSRIEGCVVEHERNPPLLSEVTDRIRGAMTEDQMIALLRDTRSVERLGGTRVSGESNQRLSFIIPDLIRAFPDARMLWMIRDGRANVASVHHRRWYDPREATVREAHHAPSAANRISGVDVRDIAPDEWARMDAFERCCWYWSYTNREIERRLAEAGAPFVRISLEHLGERVDELLAFLGLPADTSTELRAWNAARHGPPLSPLDWSAAQREVFERRCGALMDRFYPGWRDDGWNDAPRPGAFTRRARYAVRSLFTEWRIRAKKLHG